MPNRRCEICKRLQPVLTSEWKYLDKDGDHVCSIDCLIEWITSHADAFDPPLHDRAGVQFYVDSTNVSFRSHYEWKVAELFMKKGIHSLYERYMFLWESKQYTPDFTFPHYGCIVEVKGKWGASQRSKYKAFREYWDLPMLVVPWTLSERIMDYV